MALSLPGVQRVTADFTPSPLPDDEFNELILLLIGDHSDEGVAAA
ncbi:MAG: hypothetical protein ACTHMQ_03665 [Protaetiibacter sp.]